MQGSQAPTGRRPDADEAPQSTDEMRRAPATTETRRATGTAATRRATRNIAETRRATGTAETRQVPPPDDGVVRAGRGANASMHAAGPLVLDRYQLLRQLGSGGFGTVWQAHDDRLEREVAVKIVPRDRVQGGRFEREARAAARLSHPAIVTLYEAGADDDGAYLVSELVRGQTLDALLDEGRLSDRDIVAIGIAISDALAHAHQSGVVHRDVKPSNVLIPERPVSPAHPAKLTDFGVARVLGGDALTRTGDVIGTAAYMAPEQAEGLEVTASADLYALALVLYEALTGVNPIQTGTAAQRARRLGAHLPPLRRQRRDLPRELGRSIDLALRPKPRERGTIDELRRSLEISIGEVGDEPGIVAEPWRAPRVRAENTTSDPGWPPKALIRGPSTDGDPATSAAEIPDDSQPVELPAWPERGLGAGATAVIATWMLGHVLGPSPIAPVAGGLIAAGAVLAMPRIGWFVISLALVLTAVVGGHAGTGLVFAVAVLVPVATMFRAGVAWPLAAGAPLLGAFGLAGAWPAVAARAKNAWRRAALGFTGWVWLLLASPLAGKGLYLGLLPGTPARGVWSGSLYDAIHHVIGPAITTGALAPAPLWALAAVVLPYLVSGRSPAAGVVRVVVWAAVLVGGTSTLLAMAHGPSAAPSALIGALAGAALALAPTAFRALASYSDSSRLVS